MANETQNLFDEINEYDESLPIPEECSEESLKSFANNNAPAKIKAFNKLLKRVESGINKRLSLMNISISGFKLKNSFSAGMRNRSVMTKFEFIQNSNGSLSALNLNLNVNVNKFLKYPAMEVYSIVSALAYNVLNLKPQLDGSKTSELANESDVELKKVSDITKENNEKTKYESAKFLISSYLRDFLPAYFGYDKNSITNLDYISELVAEQLLSQMNDWEISQVSTFFFKFDKLDRKAALEGRKYFESSNIYPYRTAKIQEKAANMFALDESASFKDAKALNSQQQYLSLSATFAGKHEAVKDALSGGFNNENERLKDFCRAYAASFMNSNGLKDIEVNFVNSGNCEYYDEGNKHYININLSDPAFASGNVTELVMTLSHELTHAVDSSINKNNLQFNQYGGGLLGTMSENLDACDIKEARPLLEKVQAYCYQLNPNERHGRLGEISALKFLSEVYADDAEMAEQMQESINQYSKYQMQTINAAEGLGSRLNEFKAELQRLGIPQSSNAYKMIEMRIDYLAEIMNNLDISAEKNSIDEAYSTVRGMGSGAKSSSRKGLSDAERQIIETENLEKQ